MINRPFGEMIRFLRRSISGESPTGTVVLPFNDCDQPPLRASIGIPPALPEDCYFDLALETFAAIKTGSLGLNGATSVDFDAQLTHVGK